MIRHRSKQFTKVAFLAAFIMLAIQCNSSIASMLVGNSVDAGADHNDMIGDVITVINYHNTLIDPNANLTTDIELFKKTDDDVIEVFDPNGDFTFWADPNMNTAVTTEGQLQALETAYFTYDGPANLIYYSAKTGAMDGFSVYTFWPGEKNILTIDGSSKEISHLSFWIASVPEPSTCMLGLLGSMLCFYRRP